MTHMTMNSGENTTHTKKLELTSTKMINKRRNKERIRLRIREKYTGQSVVKMGDRLFIISDPEMKKITTEKLKAILQERKNDYFIDRGMQYLYQFMLYARNQ